MTILTIVTIYVIGVLTGIALFLIILWQWAISDQKKQDHKYREQE
jgi:hypothetical protein